MTDGRGVLGLPMRLAVAMVILSVCVPSLVYASETFKEDAEVSDASAEVEKMVSAADTVYYSGCGSRCTVSVSIPSGCEVTIGGEEQDMYTIRIVQGGEVRKTVYTDHPIVRFVGGPVTVSGSLDLVFECVRENGVYGVRTVSA